MSVENITIRRAKKADLSVINNIEKQLFTDPWDESAFLDALFFYQNTFFVAEENGKILGFVIAGIEDTGEAIYGHIMNIATVPECRNQGLGGRLMQRIEFECLVLGTEGVQLEVRVSNKEAQRFYQKMGYSQVFVIGGYYSDGEDAILMMKWFDN
ncbi:ribosomal-protein-alanine N-acetyltransferase [Methanoplanus sp. FWC-SCC4]|uniref:Ribosomal-protein-alanine N-acetyltransferase n=1 Tax=Methanochimaera problematica TaxID=2609417 RepID=A0AA97I2W5_9EURY|nr:ribosomal protein S18-alanine N-acetyltransferase [Methanoplanus sp. FWC-SCC4]WOF16725.1 ribosomal-protein-alanine N-acetyltransferase [Methanoplanus sp. FWC-SCC4]